MKIIFIRTRAVYDSYNDFWRLVLLSGFQTYYIDEIQPDDKNTYIIPAINEEVLAKTSVLIKCNVIWWYLERPGIPDRILTEFADIDTLYGSGVINKVWVSDWQLLLDIKKAVKNPDIISFMLLGSHPDLIQVEPSAKKIYDLAHLSAPYQRRNQFYKDIEQFKICPNGHGIERDTNLSKTKLMVTVHRDNHSYSEPLRMALAASAKLCCLSEICKGTSPSCLREYSHRQNYGMFQYNADKTNNEMIKTINLYLQNDSLRKYMANKLYTFLCRDNTFKKNIIFAL